MSAIATNANADAPAAPDKLTNRRRFLDACRCCAVDRPPVWLMRQAGRALPEYRELKEKHSFLELIQTPDLAAEVTLQPVRRFGFDAAILFSDILVIPEAMGQSYRFRDTGGLVMDFAVRTKADIERLSVERVTERLSYVDRALRLVRKELGDRTALIGFSGSPWTLATFMMEGGSAEKHTRALKLFHEDRQTFCKLAEKLTAAITAYLQMQINAGADVLQIFDSHGGQLAPTEFPEASGRWMRDIVSQLSGGARHSVRAEDPQIDDGAHGVTRPANIPVIVFSLGTHGNWDDLLATGASVLGIDWLFPLAHARRLLPANIGLQGNLAPALLNDATPEMVAQETRAVLESMRGRKGHIFNLGHGVPPNAKLENIAALVDTVRSFK
jgi:uroporphyrinogen decarboxylase